MKLLSKKPLFFIVFLILFCANFSSSFAQDANQLLQEGVAFHDAGKYEKALEKYEEALKLMPNSSVIYYEMALTYFHKEDYKMCVKYSDKVIKSKSKSTVPAYIIKGSSLDMMGKTDKSISFFEKVIKENPKNYLLHYNLALNYYKVGKLDKAEDNLIQAIGANPEHSSSHLMLGFIEYDKGRKIPSMMALNYFLLLEPNSARSEKAFEVLQKQLLANIKKGDNNEITISIGGKDDEFAAIEMVMSLAQASNFMKPSKEEIEKIVKEEMENEDTTTTEKVVIMKDTPKTEEEIFRDNTQTFFSFLDAKDKKENIWWTLYAPFLNQLGESEHIDTFCYWISQISNEKAAKWIEENPEKVMELKKWLARN
ncbi:tetratricopeptide repeat protein (plasmid) [Bernardetia sp. Wsw4-3y2]|uniref:tetratricopeptide repeat protein n=1 Tax=unclassified Bernardetia TaxID=2647129 RepID=UPI0030CB393D